MTPQSPSAVDNDGLTTQPACIRVAAVDDHRMMLDGLASHLASVPDVNLVATASTVAELLASDQSVDVVMLDLQLTDRSDPADNVARLIAAGYQVLVVSAHVDCDLVIATTSAGADGYIAKTHGMATLVAALREVAAGGTAYSPELAHCWQRDHRPERPTLSTQETRVLVAYANGAKLVTAGAVMRHFGISYVAVITAYALMILTAPDAAAVVYDHAPTSVLGQSPSTYVVPIAAPVTQPTGTPFLLSEPGCPPGGTDASGVPCPSGGNSGECHGKSCSGREIEDGKPNGCSLAFSKGDYFDFLDACNNHDECYMDYTYGKNEHGRLLCDDLFNELMKRSCNAQPAYNQFRCLERAAIYYRAVRIAGGIYFWAPNRADRAGPPSLGTLPPLPPGLPPS